MKNENRIAYIMSRFPGLSETFILREMCELERRGWNLDLYPLLYQEEAVVHDEAKDWTRRAQRPSLIMVLVANVKLLLSHPLLYLSTLTQSLLGNIASPKFLSRAIIVFPKAVWMAQKMLSDDVAHIHAHYATHPALAAWIIYRIAGIPYGITVHAHDIFVDRSMLQRKLTDAEYIVAISEYNRRFLVEHYGAWVESKTHVIHCGIYPDVYASIESHVKKQDIFEIVSIGSLRPYKGFSFLLDACALLKKRGLKFRCRIIGGGELHDSLALKIHDLAIADVVELVGAKTQAEVARILKTSDCYVQPSIVTPTGKMEGIPVSLMEAMVSELPVIATNISGIPELVYNEKTGLLVPPSDPGSLASAIMHLYNNPDISRVLARQGREFVLRKFDIMVTVSDFSNLLERCLEGATWK